MLRLVVLAPVIIGLAFLVRAGAPPPSHPSDFFWGNGGWLDNALSARPVVRKVAQMEGRPIDVAVFRASRETEYGLAFYRNREVPRYERREVPAQDHLVVVPEAYADELAKVVQPRRVSRLGGFQPQRLEFYWVSTPPTMPMEHHH